MSKREVWKFAISGNTITAMASNHIDIPEGARFLHCAAQGNSIALWYEVDTTAPVSTHQFHYFGTGLGPIPEDLVYLGTALFADGSFVLHVYEAA